MLETEETTRIEASKIILASVAEHCKGDFNLVAIDGDKYRSQQALETLHVWALKSAMVPHDKEKAQLFLGEICEQMWSRGEHRLHEEGTHPFMLTKRLTELQQWTLGSMTAYDKAITVFSESEDEGPFLGAIWRNVYEAKAEVSPVHVATLADYVVAQLNFLQDLSSEDLFAGNFEWGSPPTEAVRPSREINLEDYRDPDVVPDNDKRIRFVWDQQYPLVRG